MIAAEASGTDIQLFWMKQQRRAAATATGAAGNGARTQPLFFGIGISAQTSLLILL